MYSINGLTLEEIKLIKKAVEEYEKICSTIDKGRYSTEEIKTDIEAAKVLLDKLK